MSAEDIPATEGEIEVDRVPLESGGHPDAPIVPMPPMAPLDSDDESSVLLPPPEESNTEVDDADPEQDPETLNETELQKEEEEEVPVQVQVQAEPYNTVGEQHPLSPTTYNHADNQLHELTVHELHDPLSPENRENEQQGDRLTMSPLSLALARADADDDVLSTGGADVKTKTKIRERLALALSNQQFSGQKRSPDLVPLTRNYQSFRKQLRSLIAAIKAHKKAMDQLELARSNLYQEYDAMSRNTPLSDFVTSGLDPQELAFLQQSAGLSGHEEAEPSNGFRLAFDEQVVDLEKVTGMQVNPSSLASIQQIGQLLGKKTSLEQQKYILDFASEWHDVVTTMLDREIDLVRQLQLRRIHYEKKVGVLRKRTNTMENKGKQVSASIAEKLLRNEQKLSAAWENHEQRAARLCVLLEEVTENGWKDLFPLVQNTMTWEVNRVARDMASFGKLKLILEKMTESPLISVPATTLYEV